MQVISFEGGLSNGSLSDAEGLLAGEELSEYGGVIDGLTVSDGPTVSDSGMSGKKSSIRK